MNETHIKQGEETEFMKITCVNRLNYNYYYFAFDVVRQSNYNFFSFKESEETRGNAGSLSF